VHEKIFLCVNGSTYQPPFLIHNHHGRKETKGSEEDSKEGCQEDCKEGSEEGPQGRQEARIVESFEKEKSHSGGIFLFGACLEFCYDAT